MCGRYSLALRPSQVRQMLEDDDMPVYDAPDDEGAGAPRQSYNFAPGYHGIVFRADVPQWGAGPAREHGGSSGGGGKHKGRHQATKADTTRLADDEEADEAAVGAEPEQLDADIGKPTASEDARQTRSGNSTAGKHSRDKQGASTHYILQSMKWGLIPFWTKRNPDYASMLKTINCRDDSLAQSGGMWTTMKARKRCVVIVQGFYEWLKPRGGGPASAKVPHYVKRADGKLMCFAGLWDCVRYEDDAAGEDEEAAGDDHGLYTYTVITTDSNDQLRFLHDRMPVILDQGSDALRTWLDPARYEWSKELQDLLRPYAGALEVYPVSREVGKVGNNSPSFIIPVASKENKSNIANFFANAAAKGSSSPDKKKVKVEPEVKAEVQSEETMEGEQTVRGAVDETADDGITMPAGLKREASSPPPKGSQPPAKKSSVAGAKSTSLGRPKFSATRNVGKSPRKAKGKEQPKGSQKITNFFAKPGGP